jgi:hypothetical protein
MEIKKSAAIGFGTGGRQNTKKKQTAPRSLVDSIQIRANKVSSTRHGRLLVDNSQNLDANVRIHAADVYAGLGLNDK